MLFFYQISKNNEKINFLQFSKNHFVTKKSNIERDENYLNIQ